MALTDEARFLVTGNFKHFPERSRQGMRVVSPREFLETYRQAGT